MSLVVPGILSATSAGTFLQPFFFNAVPPVILGVVYLAIVREYLFDKRILDYNTDAQLHRAEPCTSRELKYRTLDGSCNNLNRTGMGMEGLRFGRSALKVGG